MSTMSSGSGLGLDCFEFALALESWREEEGRVRAERAAREAQELEVLQLELDRLAALEALEEFFRLFGFQQSLERVKREVMEGATAMEKAMRQAEMESQKAAELKAKRKEETEAAQQRAAEKKEAARQKKELRDKWEMEALDRLTQVPVIQPEPEVIEPTVPLKSVVMEALQEEMAPTTAPVVEAPSYFDTLLDRLTVVQAMVTPAEAQGWEEGAQRALTELEARTVAESVQEREVRLAAQSALQSEVSKLQARRQELVEEKFQLGMSIELVIPAGHKFIPRHERAEGAVDYPKLAGAGWQGLVFTEAERFEKGTLLEELQFAIQRKSRMAHQKLELAEKELGRNAGLIQFIHTLIDEGKEARRQFQELLEQCRDRKQVWLELAQEIQVVNKELIALNRRR